MKRPYLLYLLAVVVPSAAVVAAGAAAADSAGRETRRASGHRVAAMALQAFQQELGAAVAGLTAEARPVPIAETAEALAARAMAGDTASGLALGADGMEVRVALPPLPGDPDSTVRAASAPLPTAPMQVARAAGYRASLYLSRRRAAATDPAPGPDELDDATVAALGGANGWVPLPLGEDEGVLAVLPQPGAGTPAVALLAVAPGTRGGPLPLPLILVMALLLAFACLAGWIQLAGGPPRRSALSVTLLALVPALTAWGFLVHGSRLVDDHVADATRRDLARALAVARVLNLTGDPAAIRQLSGYHAFLVRNGSVVAGTQSGDLAGVAGLPAPPPSFTATGRVRTPEGTATYVALRLPGGRFAVATAPPTNGLVRAFDARARGLGAALAGWLLLLGGVLWRRRPVSS